MKKDSQHRRTVKGTLSSEMAHQDLAQEAVSTGDDAGDAAREISMRETMEAQSKQAPSKAKVADTVRNSDQQTTRPASPVRRFNWWAILAVAVVVLFALDWLLPHMMGRIELARARARLAAEREVKGGSSEFSLQQISEKFQGIADKVYGGVVHIDVVRSAYDTSAQEDLQRLFGDQSPDSVPAQGSGVIVDDEGFVVTNYHVVVGAQSINVTLHDERTFAAKVIGGDTLTDLALLKIEGTKLTPAQWGDSDQLGAGGLVWAIGSPFGLQQSMTFGIVSKKRREGLGRSQFQEFLQTDAAINPGNSGGPLVDVNGHVIGINTAILGESYRGVGFAIPSNVARGVYERLKTEGRIARGWLGVALEDVPSDRYVELGLRSPNGAVVSSISAGQQPSPAMQAGIQARDVITHWNGGPVDNAIMLSRQIAKTPVGSMADVVIVRDRKAISFRVRVGERGDE